MGDSHTVECRKHGLQEATFVCRHLAESVRTGRAVGWHDSGNPDRARPDAWCAECQEAMEGTGGRWTEESEAFACITLLCGACYDLARALNG